MEIKVIKKVLLLYCDIVDSALLIKPEERCLVEMTKILFYPMELPRYTWSIFSRFDPLNGINRYFDMQVSKYDKIYQDKVIYGDISE